MDGVLVDLLRGWCAFKGFKIPDPYPYGEQKLPEMFPVKPHDIWLNCDTNFWAELPEMPDARDLVFEAERILGAENVYFISSAFQSPEGKLHWIARHFPSYRFRFIFTPDKSIVATSSSVLIDDEANALGPFKEKGGRTILMPRLWNRRYLEAPRSLKTTTDQLAFMARAEREENCGKILLQSNS